MQLGELQAVAEPLAGGRLPEREPDPVVPPLPGRAVETVTEPGERPVHGGGQRAETGARGVPGHDRIPAGDLVGRRPHRRRIDVDELFDSISKPVKIKFGYGITSRGLTSPDVTGIAR